MKKHKKAFVTSYIFSSGEPETDCILILLMHSKKNVKIMVRCSRNIFRKSACCREQNSGLNFGDKPTDEGGSPLLWCSHVAQNCRHEL